MAVDEAYAAVMRERQQWLRKHGRLSKYKRGCRCAVCVRKNAFACRQYRETLRMLRAFKVKRAA